MVHGDGFENRSPFREAQVRLLYPPLQLSLMVSARAKIFMKFEFSAGGIVFKKEGNKNFVLLCQHSYHHGWGFPKGLIGDKVKGEKKETTAVREVEEETGAIAEILGNLEPVTYWYKFNGETIKKTVYYFIMEYLEGDITKHDNEMENVEWVKIDQVLERLTFKSDKKVFEAALPIIEKFAARR